MRVMHIVSTVIRDRLGRLDPFGPWMLLFSLIGTTVAVVAAAHTRSDISLVAAGVALCLSVVAFAASVVHEHRRGWRAPRHIPWGAREWARFERQFWAYVSSRQSDWPPAAG
jgi:uncharacterized membrane protein YfcA